MGHIQLRKSPVLKEFYQFLIKATNCGFLSRQELVSMLPPLFLDVQRNDLVLDICAAPGSKTVQILEMLYKDIQQIGDFIGIKGGVFANDVDNKRARILSHQLIRLNCCGMAVINHPGQFLPTIYYSRNSECEKSDAISEEKISDSEDKFKQADRQKKDFRIYFDKVLADVPCSGDGAIRKLPVRWRIWSPLDGVHLHNLQLQILIRSVNLAKVGGLIVYSTCSLNPIENEAVVAEIIRRANKENPGALELIDIHGKFEGLKMHRGVSCWWNY